ncbi:aminotransferase class I/II-fold pyridoxal phosphate-dependent enzyme [Pedobacter antarcticus]|uniref:aminotransferase class I/II-fold pyridoxal phosphate-dependent enzyme n=1 Tax=Pedobacter antarcticus TaxID=34086 RepID=UPI00292FB74F|nr:aminotransferase class I/II-fold pyridoxal phosphate-dependent enzyme [Pedobacter antarcticus]
MNTEQFMQFKIAGKESTNSIRKLQLTNDLTDFSSNDYLGYSRFKNEELSGEYLQLKARLLSKNQGWSGAGGSRLLSGNSAAAEELENLFATRENTGAALLFNSGYTANTSLFSCLPQKGDLVIYDQYIHASVIDGLRLSYADRLKFRHNDCGDLENQLLKNKDRQGRCYVAIESIYSMDGDFANLPLILALCNKYQARLIVDEAHAFGVFGTGLATTKETGTPVFARIITFSKAMGLHGAVVLGSQLLKTYLINFARPFIYSTALPPTLILSILTRYKRLLTFTGEQHKLQQKSALLSANLKAIYPDRNLTEMAEMKVSPIQIITVPGNENCLRWSKSLFEKGYSVYPIRSPTVPAGTERLRICVHLFNTQTEINGLCEQIKKLQQS